MALNLQNTFGLPFRSKSATFIRFASRTIALSAIEPIVWMAAFAMRLLGIDIAARSRIAFGILRGGNCVEMLRIDARSIAACVIDDESIRDRFIGQPHRNAVGFASLASETKSPVSVFIKMASPQEAIPADSIFALKSGYLFGRGVVHDSSQMVCTAKLACSVTHTS